MFFSQQSMYIRHAYIEKGVKNSNNWKKGYVFQPLKLCDTCLGYYTHSRDQNLKGILNSTMHYLLVQGSKNRQKYLFRVVRVPVPYVFLVGGNCLGGHFVSPCMSIIPTFEYEWPPGNDPLYNFKRKQIIVLYTGLSKTLTKSINSNIRICIDITS